MNVKELIERLKECDPEAKAIFSDGEIGYWEIDEIAPGSICKDDDEMFYDPGEEGLAQAIPVVSIN